MIQLLRALVLIGVVTVYSEVNAQIILEKHDDPNKSGYKSIIFNYEEDVPGQKGQKRKVTKEFDVEAHNPFNQIRLKVKNFKNNGSKTFDIIDRSDLQTVGLKKNYSENKPLPVSAGSHVYLDVKEKHAAIAYVLFLYGSYGEVFSERRSSVKVLDSKGDVSHEIEDLPFDIYSIEISHNGRFLFYGFGEYIEDSEEVEEYGFRIIDLKTNTVYYESLNTTVMGFFKHPNEISFRTSEESGRYVYLFNELSSILYKVDDHKVAMYLGFMSNLSVDGDTLTVSDYQLVK